MARSDGGAASSIERFFQLSLLGLVASGYVAVAGSGYLDRSTVVLAGLGLLLRALLIAGWIRWEISDRQATGFAISYILFFLLDYLLFSRDFLTATVHLVFFLAVIKILTAKTNRDYLYTAAIAFLELLAAAILSVDLNFFLFLALYLFFAIAALTSGEIRRSINKAPSTARGSLRRFHPRLAALSGLVTLGILAITAGLFFFLPRTADAALSRLISHQIYLPGFSNEVTFGEIGEIKETSRPVMHVSIFKREIPPGLKWRGGALSHFDGKKWSNPNPLEEQIPVVNGHADFHGPETLPGGRRLGYHVELNAVTTNALFFTGFPEKLDLRQLFVYRNENGSYRLGRAPPQRFGYDVYALLEEPLGYFPLVKPIPPLTPEVHDRYLQLPDRLDTRISQLAHHIADTAPNDYERAVALEKRLRSDYQYTLEMPGHEVSDPIAYFLFTRKKGYCEHFASAMTVMLRTLGIPARLATGFQSGIYNPISDLVVVRASDAHTWVEAWLPEVGWTTFDPTPPDPNPAGLTLFSRFELYMDAAQTFWQEWVVSYDMNRQGTLSYRVEQRARQMGIRWFDSLASLPEFKETVVHWLRRYGGGTALVVVCAAVLWRLGPWLLRLLRVRRRVSRVRRGQSTLGDATLLYQQMLQLLRRRGYHKPAWFTPTEFAASLPGDGLGQAVLEFTAIYNEWRFGGRMDVAPRLSHLLDEVANRHDAIA
jgi:transglutaminase-like putative cysteine protease